MAVVRPQSSPASGARAFLASGHWPTLLASFLYFDFCFAIWVLNGAMGPFISETFQLSAAQKGFMLSVPILAGALMRFPLGVLAQYIGRKNATLVEMAFAAHCGLRIEMPAARRDAYAELFAEELGVVLQVRVADLDYELPPELIAQRPLPERDGARLLIVDPGAGGAAEPGLDVFIDLLDAQPVAREVGAALVAG